MIKALERHRRDWDDLAELDPFWSILVHIDRKHGAWDPECFFKTGEEEMSRILFLLNKLELPRERGLALDFGCGLGRLSAPLAQHFEHCTGVDISAQMVRLARWYHRYVQGLSFETLDRQDLSPFPEQSVDFVLSILVLQHQPSKKIVKLWLRELVRVLKPNGLLIFQLPNRLGFRTRWQLRRKAYRLLRGLIRNKRILYYLGLHPMRMIAMSEAEVKRTLEDAGGKICEVLPDSSAGRHNQSLLYLVTR